MRGPLARGLAILAVAAAGCTSAPPSPARVPLPYAAPAAFHDVVASVYDFRPSALGAEARTERARALELFWDHCSFDPDTCLPRLRAELRAPSNPSLFFFDGSKLLLKLSPRADDRRLALRAIPRADLRDVDGADYLFTVHRLAVEGFDTTEAAFHILGDPDFAAVVPQQGLRVRQDYALMFMLLPTDERYYVPRAIARLDAERDETALASLLLVLWYTATGDADAAIARVAESARSSRVRAYAESMKDRTATLRTDPRVGDFVRMNFPRLETPSATQVREMRRAVMNRITDQALLELDALTVLLRRSGPP
jgi:hypothetical protein